jgi:adenylate cyclase
LADGYIRRSRGDQEGALDAFDQALKLNPNLALAYSAKAGQLISLGRAKEAPVLLTKAITISPSDPDIGFFYNYMGRAYFATGEYDQAIKWLQKSVQLQPTLYYNRAWLISAYALTGRLQRREAQAALSEYREKFQNWDLQKIRDWFAEKEPNPSPGFAATLKELYKGLEIARL